MERRRAEARPGGGGAQSLPAGSANDPGGEDELIGAGGPCAASRPTVPRQGLLRARANQTLV